jgi:hypothetical protein
MVVGGESMFDSVDLAIEEARRVEKASIEYGDFFLTAQDCIKLLWAFNKQTHANRWIFLNLLSQVQKSMNLALLSAARGHNIQTNMMLRYALESMAVALYSMEFTEQKYFGTIQQDGTFKTADTKKALSASYNWLESKFPKYNKSMKISKDAINAYSAHGNIIPTFFNTTFKTDGKVSISFFDKDEDKAYTKLSFWWISDICLGFLDTAARLNVEHPSFVLISNFIDEMQDLTNRTIKIKTEVKLPKPGANT